MATIYDDYKYDSLFILDGVRVSVKPVLRQYVPRRSFFNPPDSQSFFVAVLVVRVSDTGGLSRNAARRALKKWFPGQIRPSIRFDDK